MTDGPVLVISVFVVVLWIGYIVRSAIHRESNRLSSSLTTLVKLKEAVYGPPPPRPPQVPVPGQPAAEKQPDRDMSHDQLSDQDLLRRAIERMAAATLMFNAKRVPWLHADVREAMALAYADAKQVGARKIRPT